jgi:hypothetical protein
LRGENVVTDKEILETLQTCEKKNPIKKGKGEEGCKKKNEKMDIIQKSEDA